MGMKSYFGIPESETHYPRCPECKVGCHGCKVCGFVFCCLKCNPCHENIELSNINLQEV